MKYIKIFFGLVILNATASEYVRASKQLGSFLSPGILAGVLFALLIATWLLVGSFSKNGLKFKSSEFLKYFVGSVLFFGLMAFLKLGSAVIPKDYTEINGLNIPLSPCMEGNESLMPEKEVRRNFCVCIYEKTTADAELKEQYKRELETGRIDQVFLQIQETDKFMELGVEDCTNAMKTWTPVIVNSMKENCEKEDFSTEFVESNDLEVYCDCRVSHYQSYPLDFVLNEGFKESEIGIEIDEDCAQGSLKVKE